VLCTLDVPLTANVPTLPELSTVILALPEMLTLLMPPDPAVTVVPAETGPFTVMERMLFPAEIVALAPTDWTSKV
jgi:hypothetical protein